MDPLLREHFVLPLLRQLADWKAEAALGSRQRPLIGLNGPVGAGKSTLGRQLEELAPRFGLELMVASIDDAYLLWPERRERMAGNPFGVSRVPPGSHDVPLLREEIQRWRRSGVLRLPLFDKTLAAGQGDRSGWREQRCDALVLEGWLMGCQPLSAEHVMRLSTLAKAGIGVQDQPMPGSNLPTWMTSGAPTLRAEEWDWLPRWNSELQAYQPLWQACDGLWLLRPLDWSSPRRWRFQAESRQRRGGGGWLSSEELDRLVRASLCSLPPGLYQDPLLNDLLERGVCVSPPGGQIDPGALACSTNRQKPSTQGVAWMDCRRRCRSVWLQPSLSASSSATG